MRKQNINIQVLYIEDEEAKFRLFANNGNTSSSIDFFGYTDSFKEFGRQLRNFPSSSKEYVSYELGDVKEDWAYYLLIKVFCYKPNGATAIQIKIDTKEEIPDLIESNFYLKSMPSCINKLGRQLENWNPNKDSIFKFELALE